MNRIQRRVARWVNDQVFYELSNRSQAHKPEPGPPAPTWTVVFGVILGALIAYGLLVGVLSIGGPGL